MEVAGKEPELQRPLKRVRALDDSASESAAVGLSSRTRLLGCIVDWNRETGVGAVDLLDGMGHVEFRGRELPVDYRMCTDLRGALVTLEYQGLSATNLHMVAEPNRKTGGFSLLGA